LHGAENKGILKSMLPLGPEKAEAARRQLQKILESPGFARNERMSRFLRFVVDQHLAGRGDEIKESVIAIEVFGRSTDFNPRRDPIVRTEAARLRARLSEYYLNGGQADSLIIELPKGGYAPVFRQLEWAAEPLGERTPWRTFQAKSQVGFLHAILSEFPLPASRINPAISSGLEALLGQILPKDSGPRHSAAEVERAPTHALGSPAAVKPAEGVLSTQIRVVGRKKQLTELHSTLETVSGGRGLMLCIAGEPGIGKTTLVEEFLCELTAAGASSIARGRCSERLAGTEAYLPFLEALENLLHAPAGDWIARCMKLLAPTWYVQVAPLADGDSSLTRILLDAKAASQERMKRELVAFLQEICELTPLVIFFDDLHWADLSTVDLLSYLGSKCDSIRLLLVGTYRPSELLTEKHPFLPVKLEMQSHGRCREIAIGFLTCKDIELYLALEFPGNRFPSELPGLIHAKTEGNALFMTDLVRYLCDRGVIAEEQGHWALVKAVPEIGRDLPESVRSMIQRKIDRLDDGDRRLLIAASVQGCEFDSAVVARILNIDPAEVEERLEALDRVYAFVKLLSECELPNATLTLRYRFVHVLYQNTLYATLAATRKALWSAAAAEALLSFYGDRSLEIAAELALLFEVGRDFARASDNFALAARNAMSVYASQEAIGLLQRAIANAEKVRDHSRNIRIHRAAMELARIYEVLRQVPNATAMYDLAEKSAAAAQDVDGRIQAICAKGGTLVFIAKDMAGAREQCRRAFELVQGQEGNESLANVDMLRYLERLCAGDFDAALESYERAVPVLQERGLSAANLLGMTIRAALHHWRGENQEAKLVLDWCLEKAREIGDVPRLLQNHFLRGMSLGRQGRLGEAFNLIREAQRLAELTGERVQLARLPNTLGWLHRELQDLEQALELDLEGIRLSQEFGDTESEINSRINAGQVLLLLSEPDRAFEHLERAGILLGPFPWFKWLFETRLEAEWASYWIARGDTAQAATHARAALEITRRSLVRKYTAWSHRILGEIAALEDRVTDARCEYDAALAILADRPCPGVEWIVRKAYASLVRKTGESEQAELHAGRARAIVRQLADSVCDHNLRDKLLLSPAVRELSDFGLMR
jgi:tetratricopeptide (TPR) repeat protein